MDDARSDDFNDEFNDRLMKACIHGEGMDDDSGLMRWQLPRIKTTSQSNTIASTEKSRKSPRVVRLLGHALRSILLDLPLFIVLLTYAATVWFRHVQDNYLAPQLEALFFSTERSVTENTYYKRSCDASDVTTANGADLFLPVEATSEDAYQHQLKHGFTIFQGILKPETCENLRNFVISRNHQLEEEEIIYVIENDKRYSFGLGTEEPSVTAAIKELANSSRLRPALEKILGPDPALIEMTAITSSYGAVAQWWHDDVIASGSPVQFGRAFGPSYSVFVQLQNTTKAMGATEACPGTHFCSTGPMDVFCDENGFQLIGSDGQWGQGDALLMNMNSWHRGAAHTDPNAMDRVMLILTFVPKPMERAESRQMAQGITFSLRWDMWGHTLNDLAAADSAMAQPWATLRSLGLYKPASTSWGVDYVTSASMRTANRDNGFRPNDLDAFLMKGGIPFLPDWLENFDIDWDAGQSWPAYVRGTQKLCEEFASKISKFAIAGYVALFVFAGLSFGNHRPLRFVRGAILRVILIVTAVFLLFQTATTRVDRTGWAADIQAGRRYASMVEIERDFADKAITGPSTYPTKSDVLIETRYGSEQLAMYNDYITLGHPGNRFYRELVKKAAPTYGAYSAEFRDATALYIAETVATNHGRFLYQGTDGYWMRLVRCDVVDYVKRELSISSSGAVAALLQTARFVESKNKYGVFRSAAISKGHAVPFIQLLEKRLLQEKVDVSREDAKKTRGASLKHFRLFSLPSPYSNATRAPRRNTLHIALSIEPPHLGAWLAEGDVAEVFEEDFWYYGVIQFVNARGEYAMLYPDGTKGSAEQHSIRPFDEYLVGEQLDCYVESVDDFELCTVRQTLHDGSSIRVTMDRGGDELQLVLGDVRRFG